MFSKEFKLWVKQEFCNHIFIGKEMQVRKHPGDKVKWACSKCGKLYTVDYGIQIQDYGKITGPW